MKTLEAYVAKFHPEVIKEFERSKLNFESLVPGTRIRVLLAGFGNMYPEIRIVDELALDGEPRVYLKKPGRDCDATRYILYRDPIDYRDELGSQYWWQVAEILGNTPPSLLEGDCIARCLSCVRQGKSTFAPCVCKNPQWTMDSSQIRKVEKELDE